MSSPRDVHPSAGARTVLGVPVVDRVVLFGVFPLAAAAIAGVLPVLARWALRWDGPLPFGAVVRFIGSIHQPWQVLLMAGIGAAAGLAVGLIGWSESVTLTVSGQQLEITHDGRNRTV